MTTRTYRCALVATITVEDETVKSAMLGFGLRDGLDGPIITDEDVVFQAQQEMLGVVESVPPDRLLQMLLVNGFSVPLNKPIRDAIGRQLPGAQVKVTGVDVELTGDEQ